MRKLKKNTDPPQVKQRRGVRKNYDNKTWTPSGLQFPTSVSSHLMRAEYIPERGWVGFPSLFQDSKPYADDQQNWIDMSETPDEDWMKIYEEAERRGEVYDFGEDKKAALAFGMGSWKDQLPEHLQDNQEYEDLELSDEEADKYRAGGYVLEELVDGGEDDIVRPHGDSYEYKTVNGKYYTRKREGEWEGEEQPGWDLASGESEDSIKYKVFKEAKPVVKKESTERPTLIQNNQQYASIYDALYGTGETVSKPNPFPVQQRKLQWGEPGFEEQQTELNSRGYKVLEQGAEDFVDISKEVFVDPVIRTGKKIYNDPINFAGDIATTVGDVITSPVTASKELYDYNLGDGKFEWGNVFDPKAAGTTLDALSVVPYAGAATKLVKPVTKLVKPLVKATTPLVKNTIRALDDATRPGAQTMNSGVGSLIGDVRAGVNEIRSVIPKVKGTKHSWDRVPERLDQIKGSGAYWDDIGIPGREIIKDPKLVNYVGTRTGRPVVNVTMPDGSTQMFYKSSGWAGKSGAGKVNAQGVQTTEGMWQPSGGFSDSPVHGKNWFIKDTNYKDFYGSKTYKDIASELDNTMMQKLGAKNVDELDDMINFQGRNRPGDDFIPNQKYGGVPRFDKGGNKSRKKMIALIEAKMEKYGITNSYMKNAMMGTILSEGGFEGVAENMNYTTPGRLAEVWSTFSTYKNSKGQTIRAPKGQGSKYANALAKSGKYVKNPEALGNFIYGNRMNNDKPGDGYKYRGRGLNQLTGKGAYKSLGDKLGVDLINNPDLLIQDPDLQAEVAVKFLADRINRTLPRLVKTNSKYAQRFPNLDYNNYDNQEDASYLLTSANAGFGTSLKPETINKRLNEAKKFNYDSKESSDIQKEEVTEVTGSKITPTWWEDKEEVVQQPIEQEVYSDELPYDLFSQMSTEDQTALFGERLFDEGGIVKPAGDPWEYKKDGDKYLTRKQGNKSWITATGLPEESIKSMVFKEIPVSDRVKEANVSYQKEKRSQPETESGRRKHAWKYVEGTPSKQRTDKQIINDSYLAGDTYQKRMDEGRLTKEDQETFDEYRNAGYTDDDFNFNAIYGTDPIFIDSKESATVNSEAGYYNIKTGEGCNDETDPNCKYFTQKDIDKLYKGDEPTNWDYYMNPQGILKKGYHSLFGGDEPFEYDDMGVVSNILKLDPYAKPIIPENVPLFGGATTKSLVDMTESGWALHQIAKRIPALAPVLGLSYFIDYGINKPEGTYDFLGIPGATYSTKGGGSKYIEDDIADTWQRTKNAYSDQQGTFKLDRPMKEELNKVFGAGDAIESAGKSIQSGANWVGDKASAVADYFGFEDGGIIELNEAQAQAYAKMGYIVKEIK